jgi:hypothetical protein
MFDINVVSLPLEYWLCAIVLAVACAFAVRLRGEIWAPPFIAVVGTIAAWYMVEPIYFEDFFYDFTYSAASTAYRCLLIFLFAFIVATPAVVRWMLPRTQSSDSVSLESLHPEHLVPTIVALWLCLLAYGVYRVDGDFVAALFPVQSRSAGVNMWSRGAAEDAGATGFIVSAAAYLYVLVLSLFGLLLPLTRQGTMRVLLVTCIVISWPYAILQGSRNVTLAVVVPALAGYLLIGRSRPAIKAVIAVGAFFALDFLMRAIIELRNVGFEDASFGDVQQARHLGLNMASELIYISGFVEDRIIDISYGWGYISELLNMIPRAIWADKPALGIEYAVVRGFGGGEADIGVVATLSTGIVGQGVLNFGTWFGPGVAALLMSCWVGLLTRLRAQGGAGRTALFLIGLGLTFNLGRDITLLVLFPFVFGYIGVLMLEARQKRRIANARREERKLAIEARRFAPRASSQL